MFSWQEREVFLSLGDPLPDDRFLLFRSIGKPVFELIQCKNGEEDLIGIVQSGKTPSYRLMFGYLRIVKVGETVRLEEISHPWSS
jgi:hypothetical protein